MNLIYRRWKLGGTSARGIRSSMEEPIAIIRNDGVHPGGVMVSYVTKERFTEPVEYAFRWGCTSQIAARHTVNTVEAINWCSNKRQGRLDMQAAGVSVPETWTTEEFRRLGNLATSPFTNNDRFVARPASHAQGRQLRTGSWGGVHPLYDNGYVSRLINKVAEYRVAVIQNRVAWVARKTPGNPSDVAWNVARGGHFDNVSWENWPMEAVKEALKAAKVGGTDFCGVDVMMDADGKAFVLEINAAPSQTSPYRQSCFAVCFDYIIRNGKAHFEDPTKIKTYKAVIHPAVRRRT